MRQGARYYVDKLMDERVLLAKIAALS